MSWKDYLYFQKQDRNAIILLLFLIVLCGGGFIITKLVKDKNIPALNEDYITEFDTFQSKLKTIEAEKDQIGLDKTYTQSYPEYARQEKLNSGETIELNKADTTDLKKIPGIGTGFANRIVKYRNLLGGYASINQLKEVWGVDDDLFDKITPYIVLQGKPNQIAINKADFGQLNKHPYISYKQAKVILDIRDRKGNIESINRLTLLEEFTENDINRLKDYISFD
ncbi:helix-hairpin-helix domain-containing protein [Dysgonomonas sp. ZJ279]|uniref:helix-hairpin-helix domain-containing protein n=1 Tax=Dysgonomonas sp. ZJ279 TaxID=2709796 RepID=UPI0013EDC554|nr:helix-hairpin-helix domain-containing protein [Dysgonomonas sp. ZJ279]